MHLIAPARPLSTSNEVCKVSDAPLVPSLGWLPSRLRSIFQGARTRPGSRVAGKVLRLQGANAQRNDNGTLLIGFLHRLARRKSQLLQEH